MAYPMALRVRAVEAIEKDGLNLIETARRFKVGRDAVREWVQRSERGELRPRKPGPKEPRKVTPAHRRRLRQMVERQPGISSEQAAAELDHQLHPGTIRKLWLKMDLTRKKSR